MASSYRQSEWKTFLGGGLDLDEAPMATSAQLWLRDDERVAWRMRRWQMQWLPFTEPTVVLLNFKLNPRQRIETVQ